MALTMCSDHQLDNFPQASLVASMGFKGYEAWLSISDCSDRRLGSWDEQFVHIIRISSFSQTIDAPPRDDSTQHLVCSRRGVDRQSFCLGSQQWLCDVEEESSESNRMSSFQAV